MPNGKVVMGKGNKPMTAKDLTMKMRKILTQFWGLEIGSVGEGILWIPIKLNTR